MCLIYVPRNKLVDSVSMCIWCSHGECDTYDMQALTDYFLSNIEVVVVSVIGIDEQTHIILQLPAHRM